MNFFQKYYEEQPCAPRPTLGGLSASFSSSGPFSSSLDSPLRDHLSTWGFVPPSIAENQTPSDAGASAESGFHDMSRQASKTESSNSAPDSAPGEQVMEDLLKQCMQSAESETSRSSSDTITMEDQLENGSSIKGDNSNDALFASNVHSQGNSDYNSDDQSSANNDTSVFEETGPKLNLHRDDFLREDNQRGAAVFMSPTYEDDFPAITADNLGKRKFFSDTNFCDVVINKPTVVIDNVRSQPVENINANVSDKSVIGDKVVNKDDIRIPLESSGLAVDNKKTSMSDIDSQLDMDRTNNLNLPSPELSDDKVSKYDEMTHL